MNTETWIYVAGPLFSTAERNFNSELASHLQNGALGVFLPQDECNGFSDPADIYEKCIDGIRGASVLIAVLDGTDADSGTAWEMGYAVARGIPVIGIRTDFRRHGDDGGLNLMLSRSCTGIIEISSLTGATVAEISQHILKAIGDISSIS